VHIHALDVYHPGTSSIHHLDARVKLVLTVAFITTVIITPDGAWCAYVLLTGLTLGLIVASRLGVGFVQRRAAVALPFTLAAVTIAFSTPGRPLVTATAFGWRIALTDTGLIRFVSTLLRSWLSVQVAVVSTASTSFPTLLHAMRSLHLPKVLVTIVGFTYRYLFVIANEALRLMRARTARSGAPDGHGGRSVFWRAQVTGGMVGSLFLRSIERSERIYNGMLARGYDGDVRSLHSPVLRSRDILITLPIVLALVVIQILARLLC
jgi:cobalt/nickel transport system permease protein